MARKRSNTNSKPVSRRTFAVARGSESRPFTQVRGLSKADATSAARDHAERNPRASYCVAPDRDLIDSPRGRGGLAGNGRDAGTRAMKAEEAGSVALTESGNAGEGLAADALQRPEHRLA